MDQLFEIFKVKEEDAPEIAASDNAPHIHDYEELLIGMEGELDHFIDFKSEMFASPYISFVTKGKMHRVQP